MSILKIEGQIFLRIFSSVLSVQVSVLKLEGQIFLWDYFVCLFLKCIVNIIKSVVNIIMSVEELRFLNFVSNSQDTFVPTVWYAQYGRLAKKTVSDLNVWCSLLKFEVVEKTAFFL